MASWKLTISSSNGPVADKLLPVRVSSAELAGVFLGNATQPGCLWALVAG